VQDREPGYQYRVTQANEPDPNKKTNVKDSIPNCTINNASMETSNTREWKRVINEMERSDVPHR
jgi:hypothetical protein